MTFGDGRSRAYSGTFHENLHGLQEKWFRQPREPGLEAAFLALTDPHISLIDSDSGSDSDSGAETEAGSDVNIRHEYIYQHNQTDLDFLLPYIEQKNIFLSGGN